MKIRKESKIAIVVLLALLVAYAGVNFLKGVHVFKKPLTLHGKYERVNGLTASNPVVLHGFKIGQVRSVDMSRDGKDLLVTMTIYEEVDIPKDSKAVLRSADILGSMQIQIVLGESTLLVSSGDTLKPEIEGDLVDEVNEQIRPIKIKAESLLSSVDSVIKVVEAILNVQSQENIIASFSGINNAIASLEHTAFQIDTIVQEERDRISNIVQNVQNLSAVLSDNSEELNNVIRNFSSLSDTLAKADIARTITKTNEALAEIQQIVDKINSGDGSLSRLINDDGLYRRIEDASSNLDLLVEDIRLNPNRYLHFSVFGRKNKSVELSRKELEELREYVRNNEE